MADLTGNRGAAQWIRQGGDSRALDQTGKRQQSNGSGRRENVEEGIRQGKRIGVALREGLLREGQSLLCGM